MKDERMQSLLDAWYRDRDEAPRDPDSGVARVMADISRTRQRSRWWPLPISYPRTPPTTASTGQYHLDPIPAMDGRTPTVNGRTRSMLSPIKAITVGAIVAAVGGVFFIAQPFQQQGRVPGAEADAIASTWVTGTIEPAASCSSGDTEVDGDVTHQRNVECRPQTWSSDDRRLTGDVARRWNMDVHRLDEGSVEIGTDAAYLANDGGSWVCLASYLATGSGSSTESVTGTTYTCTGDGDYDGLSAILVSEFTDGFSEEFVGLIFSGEFPPMPEPPAAE